MNRNLHLIALLTLTLLVVGCKDAPQTATAPTIKVKTEVINPQAADGSHSFSGTVGEERGTAVSFTAGGTVKRIFVEQGQTIARGALVAEIDKATAENAYAAALAAREQAEDAVARMKKLYEAGSLAEIKWIEVQSKLRQAVSAEQIAKKGLTDCKLYAPCSGYVSEKPVEAGQNVAPGLTVVKIVDIDRVKVKVAVPEEEISAITVGSNATVTVAALGGRTFTGRVTEKSVEANPLSRTYDVKILVNNPQHTLLPGMVCEASFAATSSGETAILLAANLVQIDVDNRPFVWCAVGDKAKKTYVTVGASVGNKVIISTGLKAGDRVIVEGQQKVSEGTKISY